MLGLPCFRPDYSVQTHITTSFGSIAFLTMAFVVLVASLCSIRAGEIVKEDAEAMMRKQVTVSIQESSRLTSDVLTEKLTVFRGISAVMVEFVRDRIVGYPNEGYEADSKVPFTDYDTGNQMYPLASPLLPLDWEIPRNLVALQGDEELLKHINGSRANFFTERSLLERMSTATPSFFFPGTCNPSISNPDQAGYRFNCTAADNDLETVADGVVVTTTKGLAEKSGDIGVLLKPLWETTADALTLKVYFFNSGLGAEVGFPGFVKDAQNTYISIGCDWMLRRNPHTQRALATEEEIGRCHPAGAEVSYRDFNPLEHEFCRDQTLHPEESRSFGPIRNDELNDWSMITGTAVFDRNTGQFIACTGVVTSVATFAEVLMNSVVGDHTEAAVVLPDGTVLAGAGWNSEEATSTVNIAETHFLDAQTFQSLVSVVNWDSTWEPREATDAVESASVDFGGRILSAYPVPPVPDQYDATYQPEYYVIFSIGGAVFDIVQEEEKAIDDEINDLIVFSVWVAAVGYAVLLVMIIVVSFLLTKPLNWIENVTKSITSLSEDSTPDETALRMSCNPHTEIGELVAEFESMITGFSGDSASHVVLPPNHELHNTILWKAEFAPLYNDRRTNLTGGNAPAIHLGPNDNPQAPASARSIGAKSTDSTRGTKVNVGTNLPLESLVATTPDIDEAPPAYRSHLFAALVCLIITPVFLTSVAICTVVTSELRDTLPSLTDISKDLSFQVELDSLRSSSQLRAALSSLIFEEPIRNAHVMTRVSGWLLFDAIERSDCFTTLEMSVVEECKTYPMDDSCPFFLNETRGTCDCEWDDPFGSEFCNDFGDRDTRYLQQMGVMAQRLPGDSDPLTGNRYTSNSFPEYSNSPATTSWWDSPSTMPGSEKGVNASGYDTIYDRTRVTSATSVVQLPLNNYMNTVKNLNGKRLIATIYTSDADGMEVVYTGCAWGLAYFSQFQITETNSAGSNQPELCPSGKYGFDARCRAWYAIEKESSGLMTVIPSFQFSEDDGAFASVGTSLEDPRNGEYVGQILIDFAPGGLMETLRSKTESHYFFLIAPESVNGGDTIMATNYTPSGIPKPISEVALPFDAEESANREAFGKLVEKMKRGEFGDAPVSRTLADGSEEDLWLSFSPVFGRLIKPDHPDDFSRGVDTSEVALYSLGIMKLRSQMAQPFTDAEQVTSDNLDSVIMVLPLLVALIVVLSLLATMQISLLLARPILQLLHEVREFNNGKVHEEMPLESISGSREESAIFASFSKVYECVRMSNSAFFKGDLEWVYETTKTAHDLFIKVHDEKAVGVASNNLGITLLAIYREHYCLHGRCYKKTDNACCADMASFYLDNAVRIAEEHYKRADFDVDHGKEDNRVAFAQELANRLFNRGLFYYVCHGDPCCPKNSFELGINDLKRARELDDLVSRAWLEKNDLVKRSEVYFDRLVQRIHGLASVRYVEEQLFENGWNGFDVVEEAVHLLTSVWKVSDAPIFDVVSRLGRLQQLEGAVIRCKLACGQDIDAMKTGIRMLVEDEYVFEPSLAVALEALSRDMRFAPDSSSRWSEASMIQTHQEMDALLEDFGKIQPVGTTNHTGKTAVANQKRIFFCTEINDEGLWPTSVTDKIRFFVSRLYNDYVADDDIVGLATNEIKSGNPLYSKLYAKITHKKQQEEALEQLFRKGGEEGGSSQSLVVGLQALMQSSMTESFVVLVTDGSSWDKKYKAYSATMKSVITRQNKTLGDRMALNVIVIGLELDSEEKLEGYKTFTAVETNRSIFINATRNTLDDAFDRVSRLISNRDPRAGKNLRLGTTWERF